ncbi:MauE/DoxX family redox-associated membrane protein [Longitalea arenae]|uniref:MauE/DoxX family redox-associated membrane protein n=1 Tax=Longitalea arenae TaxID=2812558 RepID=UPI001967E96E|nr:MauE/DoxX family redox-associated membrane protein [Longitalea arenae]
MKNAIVSGNRPGMNVIARMVANNRKAIVEVIAALFILLFLYTALNKTIDFRPTINVLKTNPAFANLAAEISWTIVTIEYITAVLLFLPQTKRSGLIVSALLMSAFTAYIIYMMVFVPNLPCSCGGVISELTWSQHLIFNVFFILLSLAGIRMHRKISASV